MRSFVPVLLSAFLAASAPIAAATTCVGTAAELQAALSAAETNGEDDLIQVRTGLYPTPPGGFRYQGSQPDDLIVRGGHRLVAGFCLRLFGAAETVLDGHDADRVLLINSLTDHLPEIAIEHFTFYRGLVEIGGGAGLHIEGSMHATVRFNAFLVNAADGGGGLYAYSDSFDGSTWRVSTNLFAANGATNGAGAAWFYSNSVASPAVTFDGNTVADNHNNAVGGVGIASLSALVVNNILWRNDGIDLDLYVPMATLERNNVADVEGTFETTLGNLNADPLFAAGGYALTPDSPLLDQGTASVVDLPAIDLAGAERVSSAAVDIGAYELGFVFLDSFESGDTTNWTEP